MPRVFMVSKPVCPPWSDSSKNLVRDVVLHSRRDEFNVITARGHEPAWPRVRWEPIHSGAGRHAPALSQNLRTLLRLLRPDTGVDLYHFFFAPNPRTCRTLAPLVALKGKPSIHTICSAPRSFDGVARLMFADKVVALSRATARRLRDAGVPGVVEIPPGIDGDLWAEVDAGELARSLDVEGHPVVLYPGDLEDGAALPMLEAIPELLRRVPEARVVMACRAKTSAARAAADSVRRLADERGFASSLRLIGEVRDVPALLSLAAVVALPVLDLYRKMDVPMVLLEAMAVGRPVVVSDVEPLSETVSAGGGIAVAPGDPALLAAALADLLERPERREALGEEGRRAVRSKWDARLMAARYEELYAELAA